MIEIDRSGWRRVRFGDVVTNTKETVKDPVGAGLGRVVALEHMEPGSLQLSGWQDAADGTTFTRRFRAGQTLFAKRRAYQRKVAYADFDGICSGDILAFEAKPDELLPLLLPFIVQSDAFFEHALRTSAGSLSPRTKWQDLANWEFGLPPLDEQNRLAELLWAAEGVRRAHALRLAASARVERALLLRLRQGLNVGGGSNALGDFVRFEYGKSLAASARVPGDVPVVGSAGVVGSHSAALIDGPAIVVGRKGNAGAIHWLEGRCYPIDTTYWVEVRCQLGSRSVYHLLRALDLPSLATTTAIPGLDRNLVHSLRIDRPDSPDVAAICGVLDDVARASELGGGTLTSLQQLQRALSVHLFAPSTADGGGEVGHDLQ